MGQPSRPHVCASTVDLRVWIVMISEWPKRSRLAEWNKLYEFLFGNRSQAESVA